MASFITCTYPSKILCTNVTFHMILPKKRLTVSESEDWNPKAFPSLYLLHGAMEDGLTIIHNSNICALADMYDVAIILPSLNNSFFINKQHEFLVNELVPYTRKYFSLSQEREDTYIAGFSMGGYGAFYNGLKRPDLFSKIISISGSLDISLAAIFVRNCGASIPDCLVDKQMRKAYELEPMIRPDLSQQYYLSCGKNDFLTAANERFCNLLLRQGIDYTYAEREGGHDWKLWSEELKAVFDWINIAKKTG